MWIDCVVVITDRSTQIVMTVHSTHHNGGSGQHPSQSSFTANSDLTENPLIAGFEWNIRHEIGQVGVRGIISNYHSMIVI